MRVQNCSIVPHAVTHSNTPPMNTTFISGTPKQFADKLNLLIAESPLALALEHVTFCGGQLAAVITERADSPSVSGSLLGVGVLTGPEAEVTAGFATMRAENPCWSAVAAFAAGGGRQAKGGEAAPGGVLVVVKLVQP